MHHIEHNTFSLQSSNCRRSTGKMNVQIPQHFIARHISAFSASIIAYMPVCISRATVPIEPSFATYSLYLLFIGCTSKNFYPITISLLKSTIRIYCIKSFFCYTVIINIFLWFLCIHILTVY